MDCDNGSGSFLDASISSDLALKIIQYLNVVDSGKLACVSQRYYYLVHQYRRLKGPELATTSTSSVGKDMDATLGLMVENCQRKLQTKPNLVLHFSASNVDGSLAKKLSFGGETIGLSVVSPGEIQVYEPSAGPKGLQGKLDDKSHASLMAMNFPGATVLPFVSRGAIGFDFGFGFLERRLKYRNKNCDDGFWKAMILYATGSSTSETSDDFMVRMQAIMPNAVIVGGVCEEGQVSIPKYSKEELGCMAIKDLRYLLNKYKFNLKASQNANPTAQLIAEQAKYDTGIEKSELVDLLFRTMNAAEEICAWDNLSSEIISGGKFFGVVLGGNVPVRSVVSRGVHSILNNNGPPRPFSNLIVEKAEFSKPGGEGIVLDDEDGNPMHYPDYDGPPMHMIRKIKDKNTGTIYSANEVVEKYLRQNMAQSLHLGLKRKGHDGFELFNKLMQMNSFVVVTDGSEASEESLEGADLDFFSLTGAACTEDMDRTMSKLREQTKGEEILGALMYTCSGRGPSPYGLIPERMSDATRFARVFPDVPCLGLYADGEFGPVALAGNENVFQIGRAMYQGFTAVFALFIVPVNEGISYNLDDSTNNVREFVREQLHPS